MGKWAEKKSKNTIKDEIYRKLSTMLEEGRGRSRNEDKKTGADKQFIYATKTYTTYHAEAKRFAEWCMEQHPEVRHLKDLKPYADDYLQSQIDMGLSAWTIATRKAAISKTLGINYCDLIQTPPRERKNIVRSRYKAERDKHISAKTEQRLAMIVSATGLRRRELTKITGDALRFNRNGLPYIQITKGTKGGKPRTAWLMGANKAETDELVELFKSAGKLRLVPNVHSAFDEHHYRGEYAKRVYNKLARPIDKIPKKDRYVMRKDRAGEVLDKKAMRVVSRLLGHNRLDVIAQNYLYCL